MIRVIVSIEILTNGEPPPLANPSLISVEFPNGKDTPEEYIDLTFDEIADMAKKLVKTNILPKNSKK